MDWKHCNDNAYESLQEPLLQQDEGDRSSNAQAQHAHAQLQPASPGLCNDSAAAEEVPEGGFPDAPAEGVPIIYEDELLDDLRAFQAQEEQHEQEEQAPPQPEYLDEEDLYRMKELIHEKPRDVIQWIEEEGVIKLGEFEVKDSLVLNTFGDNPILTFGAEHLDCDWASIWLDILSDKGRLTKTGWSTNITLEAHAVNIRDAAAPGGRGLLQPLLKRYSARGCSIGVFALPAVQAVIHFKWAEWARRFLLYELLLYATWLVSFSTFSLLFEGEDPEQPMFELLQTSRGVATMGASVLAVVAMIPFLYMEVCTIWVYQLGWINLWNLIDLTCYAVQVAITVLYMHRQNIGTSWFSITLSVQHILLWSKLHYFARAFSPTKSLLVDTIRVVIDDMKWFLLFLSLTMLGFAFAFYCLFRQDREDRPDFSNLWHSFASMFAFLLAMFDYNVLYTSTNPITAMILFMVYEFTMNIMLLNIMIAIMTSSFAKVTQDEGLRFLFSKAQIIDELEATLPRWLQRKRWFPPFVHILKVHPSSTYEINLTSVWSGIGLMENNLLNANQETRLRVEAADERMTRINRKLDVMIKMMMGVMQGASRNAPHQAGGFPIGRGYPAAVNRQPSKRVQGSTGLRGYYAARNRAQSMFPSQASQRSPSDWQQQQQQQQQQPPLPQQGQSLHGQEEAGTVTKQQHSLGGAPPIRHARSDLQDLHASDRAFADLVQAAAATNGLVAGNQALDPFLEGSQGPALPGGGWRGPRQKTRNNQVAPPQRQGSQLTAELQAPAADNCCSQGAAPGASGLASFSTPCNAVEEPSSRISNLNSPHNAETEHLRNHTGLVGELEGFGSLTFGEGAGNSGRGFAGSSEYYSGPPGAVRSSRQGGGGLHLGWGSNVSRRELSSRNSFGGHSDRRRSSDRGGVQTPLDGGLGTPRSHSSAAPTPLHHPPISRGASGSGQDGWAVPTTTPQRSSRPPRGWGWGWETQQAGSVGADGRDMEDVEAQSHDGISEPGTFEGGHSHGTLVWPRTTSRPGRFRRDLSSRSSGYVYVPSSSSAHSRGTTPVWSPAAVLGRRYSIQQQNAAAAHQLQQQQQQWHQQHPQQWQQDQQQQLHQQHPQQWQQDQQQQLHQQHPRQWQQPHSSPLHVPPSAPAGIGAPSCDGGSASGAPGWGGVEIGGNLQGSRARRGADTSRAMGGFEQAGVGEERAAAVGAGPYAIWQPQRQRQPQQAPTREAQGELRPRSM